MVNSRLSIKIDRELHQNLKILADKEGKLIGFLLDKAVENYLKAKKIFKKKKK